MDIKKLETKCNNQEQQIKELKKTISTYKRDNAFLKCQLNNKLDKYSKLKIAQLEALSLIEDVEHLKKKLKAV